MIKNLAFFAAFGAVALSAPANAQDAVEPVAGLRVYSGSSLDAKWYGSGSVKVEAPLCLSSSTGSFRLTVQPGEGLQGLSANQTIAVSLEIDGFSSQTRQMDGALPLVFVGKTTASSPACETGANASLAIDLGEEALTGAVAGSYFDQFTMTIEPL